MFIRRVVEAREKRSDKAPNTLVKLRKIYMKDVKFRVQTYVAEWCELRVRVASLLKDLESSSLEMQAIPGLVSEAARLRQ